MFTNAGVRSRLRIPISTVKRYHTALLQADYLKRITDHLISSYWEIRKSIIERQKWHKSGKSVVEKLAEDLQKEFSGMDGLSSHTVWRMRMFYREYEKLPPMVAEIGWSHNI